jgi:hypothetical protein
MREQHWRSKMKDKFLVTLIGAIMLFVINNSMASILTVEFDVEAVNGPLSGATSTGTFSFDTDDAFSLSDGTGSIFTPDENSGFFDDGTLPSLTLDFSWNGITYNTSTADFYLIEILNYEVVDFGFGSYTNGIRTISSMSEDFGASFPEDPFVSFSYAVPTSFIHQGFVTDVRGDVPSSSVPEPSAISLLLTGLISFGVWRSRNTRSST